MAILWGVPAPQRKTDPLVGLIFPRQGESLSCVKLGAVVGVMTHFVNGQSIPCLGEIDCPCHYLEAEWKGYCAVWAEGVTWRGKRAGRWPGVLVVTKAIGAAVDACARGSVLIVKRGNSKQNDPCSLECKGMYKGEIPLPEAFDPKPYVLRACNRADHKSLRLRHA